jgi:hypothetical protein
VFVPGKPFQLNLMFAGKDGAYQNEALSGLNYKHSTRLERLARDKHSSPLRKSVNFDRNFFIRLTPGVCVIKNTPVIVAVS